MSDFMTVKKATRNYQGNMLWLSLLGFLTIIIGLMVGASFINLLFVQNQVQKLTDEATINGAVKLNDNNRIGQMNDLISHCRQLVYTSREMTYSVPNTSPDLQLLSQQILDEDRAAAVELEQERKRLQALCANESKKAITESLDSQTSIYRSLLPWLRMQTPHIVSVEFGSVKGVTSNATMNPVLEELASHDKSLKLYDESSKLYFGNIDAKLPGDDSDLTFKLSSLAAPVNGTVSPARLALVDIFDKQKGQQLQSAAKVTVGTEVKAGSLSEHKQDLNVTSTATTNGAIPPDGFGWR
ncbi:MAG: hypothetical protein C5B53_11240 [Candidatus Melainabacteria bacterium]|nr:MAG: hypothetical protein C5B53_11240 [Candidatus Melainabacteria bacterium]